MQSFAEFLLIEDKVEAILRLAHTGSGTMPTGYRPAADFFVQPVAPVQVCRDMQVLADEERRGRLTGFRRAAINPRLLVPTQPSLNATQVADFLRRVIKTPVVVGRMGGKLYCIDGHHRAAAALAMGYSSIVADVLDLSTIQ